MIGGQVVGLFIEHFVVENVRHDAHIAAYDVLYVDFFAGLDLETYHILLSGVDEALCFFLSEHQGVSHLHSGPGIVLEVGHFLALGIQLFGCVERHVGFSVVEQLSDVPAVDVAPLALAVGAVVAAEAYAFVELNAQPLEGFDDILLCARHKAGGVGVFDAENEVAAVLAGEKIVVEGGTHAADMQRPRGAGCEAHTDFSFGHIFILGRGVGSITHEIQRSGPFYGFAKVRLFYKKQEVVLFFLTSRAGAGTNVERERGLLAACAPAREKNGASV